MNNNDDILNYVTIHHVIIGGLVFTLIVAFVITVLQPLIGSY